MRSNTRLFLIYAVAVAVLAPVFVWFLSVGGETELSSTLILVLAVALVSLLSGAAVQRFIVQPARQEMAEVMHRSREELEQRVEERTAELQRNAERLSIMHDIDRALLAARRPELIGLAAIGRIRHLVPCQYALVLSTEPDGQIRVLASSQTAIDAPTPGSPLRARAALYAQLVSNPVLLQGQIDNIEDLTAVGGRSAVQEALFEMGARQYVIVPLVVQDELAGTLNLESERAHAFTDDHVTIAREVATSLTVALRQVRLNARVQQELEERMEAERVLQGRTLALEARNAELDAFAHTVAHGLQNPLTVLLGYSDLLRQGHPELPLQRQDAYLEVIGRNAQKMRTIIDELLLLASVRSREEVRIEPLDMGDIVAEAQGRLQYLADGLEAEIRAPEEWPMALGYAPWVEEVWANYLSNALKYGGRPPRIELGFTLPEEKVQARERAIRYWVWNDGPGLSPEEQDSLFTPFERLHQDRAEGHGLGLSIVERIVHRLGGRVGVESPGEPGGGSTFYFTLPLADGYPAEGSGETAGARKEDSGHLSG